MAVFGVIMVHFFPHSDWIRRDKDTRYLSVYSPNAEKYEHFLPSAKFDMYPQEDYCTKNEVFS